MKFRISPRTRTFRRAFFPEATDNDWNDWRWQLRHSIRGLDALERLLDLSEDERSALQRNRNSLPNSITPYYASLLDRVDASQALRRTMVMVNHLVVGTSHFRSAVSKGLEIVEGLRGHTTGYAVPTFAIDVPGGGGKIPILPGSQIPRDGDHILLRNYEGRVFRFPDPQR